MSAWRPYFVVFFVSPRRRDTVVAVVLADNGGFGHTRRDYVFHGINRCLRFGGLMTTTPFTRPRNRSTTLSAAPTKLKKCTIRLLYFTLISAYTYSWSSKIVSSQTSKCILTYEYGGRCWRYVFIIQAYFFLLFACFKVDKISSDLRAFDARIQSGYVKTRGWL